MMTMMTGRRKRRGESARRAASAHLERGSVTPPSRAVSLFSSTFRREKTATCAWLRVFLPEYSALKQSVKVEKPRRGLITQPCSGHVPLNDFPAFSIRSSLKFAF